MGVVNMGWSKKALDLTQPIFIDILGYLYAQGMASITWDDGSGAGGFVTEPSNADKAVLVSSKDNLSGVNSLKNNSTQTNLFLIDLGDLYQVALIKWRTKVYYNGTGSSVTYWQFSDDGTNWTAIDTIVTDNTDTAYLSHVTMPRKIRYIRLRTYSTNATNRDWQWGRLMLLGDARTVA
jgi:hypothetical protein